MSPSGDAVRPRRTDLVQGAYVRARLITGTEGGADGRARPGVRRLRARSLAELHRSAYLLTGDHHLAEDLAQTALERTYAKWRTVRSDDALAYCRRVLVNLTWTASDADGSSRSAIRT